MMTNWNIGDLVKARENIFYLSCEASKSLFYSNVNDIYLIISKNDNDYICLWNKEKFYAAEQSLIKIDI